jgi:protein TonB
MMMALRNSPSEYALINALDGGARRPQSKALVIAIAASVAFHLGLLTYLTIERMGAQALPAPPDRATSMTLVSLPPLRPAQPTAPPRQPAVAVHEPAVTPLHSPTTISTLKPPPAAVVSSGVGQLGGLAPFSPPAPMRLITDPTWLSQPTAAEMSRFYPQRDVDLGVTGQVALLCGVVASGKLADCRVVSETPLNAGFADAALKLSAYFRMTPRTIDGQPVDGGQTRISIAFRLNDAPGAG